MTTWLTSLSAREHFDEYVLRMDERFLGVEKRMEQGFAYAEKAREQERHLPWKR